VPEPGLLTIAEAGPSTLWRGTKYGDMASISVFRVERHLFRA
jgi:hypothetical protein